MNPRPFPRPGLRALLIVTLVATAASRLAAQQAEAGRGDGGITGTVVDAGSGSPLSGASVAIEAAGDAAVVQPAGAGAGAFLSRGLTALTGTDGTYRFAGLVPGAYRVFVRHLGYRESVLDVDLSRSTFQVSVGLVMNPIRLEPMTVEASSQSFGRTRSSVEEARFGRTDAEELRQQRFLESDARILTQSDVTEAVTLGESDLLRALQRLPGVSARDDYTAGLWTRGAPWSQTRVYYDGLPLFNPVHAFGLLSGINPDAVGLASFHPGVRSASIGDGAAGVLTILSRAAERPGVHGLSDLSVTSARATLDLGSQDGMRGLVLSARRSYVDVATQLARLAGSDSTVYMPYAFMDLTARGDVRLGPRTAIEASGLMAQDDIHGNLRRLLMRTAGSWGNQVGRVTLEHGAGVGRLRTSMGISRFNGLINPPAPVSIANRNGAAEVLDSQTGRPVPEHGSTHNGLTVFTAATEIAQAAGTRRPSWAAGLQLVHYQQSFSGQYPRPYPVTVLPDTLFMNRALSVPTFWGEHRWLPLAGLAIETGARLELPVAGGTTMTPGLAPRLTVRRTMAGGRATASAGVARSWQYTQALAPAGPSIGPDLYVTDVWLLAGDTIPAIRSDIATLGSEVFLGHGWLLSGTGYLRRATGVAVPDPEPGVLTKSRPILISSINRARGLELGLRRIVGRTTASVSYTLARSMVTASGFTFPASADRRHVVDATVMFRATPGFRIGAAMTAGTGSPFSRFILTIPCDSLGKCTTDTLAQRIEMPNAARTPSYAALDLLFDWEGSAGRARVGAFLQIRNVLNRANAVTYTGSLEPCPASFSRPTMLEARPGTCDRFDRGVPLLPLAGVRIAF